MIIFTLLQFVVLLYLLSYVGVQTSGLTLVITGELFQSTNSLNKFYRRTKTRAHHTDMLCTPHFNVNTN